MTVRFKIKAIHRNMVISYHEASLQIFKTTNFSINGYKRKHEIENNAVMVCT